MPVSDQGYREDRFQVIPRSLIFILTVRARFITKRGQRQEDLGGQLQWHWGAC